jgi:CheY-like chemotaxis protein
VGRPERVPRAILGGATTSGVDRPIITRHTLTEIRQPLRILVAEDNPVNRELATTMLRKRGHQVDTATNGLEAVAAVKRGRYDLVLMDIQMPEMDGFEATKAIRALGDRGKLPVVALTAHALSGERERCLAHGMDGYLSKPFKTHELFATVEGWGSGLLTAGGTALQNTPSVVDLETLRAELRDADSEDALDGILDSFLASVPERVVVLREALASGTAVEVASAAHALKSSAGAIGAGPFAKLLGEVEAAGRTETLVERSALADQIQDNATAVLTELRTYRGKAG